MSKTYPPDRDGRADQVPQEQQVRSRRRLVGERGSTQIDAKARWNAHRFRYGPLKEEDK